MSWTCLDCGKTVDGEKNLTAIDVHRENCPEHLSKRHRGGLRAAAEVSPEEREPVRERALGFGPVAVAAAPAVEPETWEPTRAEERELDRRLRESRDLGCPLLSPSDDEETPDGQKVTGVGLYEVQVSCLVVPKRQTVTWHGEKVYVWARVLPTSQPGGEGEETYAALPLPARGRVLGQSSKLRRAMCSLLGRRWHKRDGLQLKAWQNSIWKVSARTVYHGSEAYTDTKTGRVKWRTRKRVLLPEERYTVFDLVECRWSKPRGNIR